MRIHGISHRPNVKSVTKKCSKWLTRWFPYDNDVIANLGLGLASPSRPALGWRQSRSKRRRRRCWGVGMQDSDDQYEQDQDHNPTTGIHQYRSLRGRRVVR